MAVLYSECVKDADTYIRIEQDGISPNDPNSCAAFDRVDDLLPSQQSGAVMDAFEKSVARNRDLLKRLAK